MAVGLITCGEVEDVVGVLTPFGSGVALVFHVLLVELRLLLVAEVEEGDRQEEGEAFNKTYQNSLQNRFPMSQTRIRKKSQMSELCGPIQG